MKIQPLHDRVLIKRIPADAVSPGGIIIPHTAQEKQMEGYVLRMGPGSMNEAGKIREITGIKPGDRVIFQKFAGTDLKEDGTDCLLIRFEDVVAVVLSD